MRRLFLGAITALLVLGGATAAWGHGDYSSSDPAEGARVQKAPGQVSLTLTEAPGPGSTLKVADGCRRDVAQAVSRSGSDLQARVSAGEPGHWQMKYRAVSSVDGHVTKGSVHFTVAGKKDCSRDEPVDESPDTQIDGGADTRVANEDPPDEGGGFPIVGLGIGTVVLVGLALLLRRSTG